LSYPSETQVARAYIIDTWINPAKDNGIDLGFGGDPISSHAIAMDLPSPYAETHDETGSSHPQHLKGDARNLYWFRDGVLDYVYSSHLLEDFPNTQEVLREWLRVLKPGGKLILVQPDEMKYREFCKMTGQDQNAAHAQPLMSQKWLTEQLESLPTMVLASGSVSFYSFFVVAEKL
jgi:SAM-dependent methyltransferase